MSMFSDKPTKKKGTVVGFGPGGSGKTTFFNTMPGVRYWIDAEHSGDHIRDLSKKQDKVLYTTSYRDLQDAVREMKTTADAGSLIIDPYTTIYESLIDKVDDASPNGITFKGWGMIKKPDKRIWTDLLNLPCHVGVALHEKDEYEMRPNERGKLEPIKLGVKADAEKKIIYRPDIVLHFFVRDGKHYARIDKIRIRKELAIKTGLQIGVEIENPTWDTFAPVIAEYESGDAPAIYTDDRDTSQKDEKVLTELAQEVIDEAHKKVEGQAQRGEKALRDLKVYGFQDEEQIANTRMTALGVEELANANVHDLVTYVEGLKNNVNMAKASQKEA